MVNINNPSMLRYALLLQLSILLPSGLAKAQSLLAPVAEPTTLVSEISAVTVYRQGALITRRGTIALTPGRTKLCFVTLELGIDPETIQLAVEGQASVFALTAGVDVGRLSTSDATTTSPLDDDIERLHLREDSLAAEQEGWLAVLDLLSANVGFASTEAGASVGELVSAATLYRSRTAEAKRTIATLERALAAVQARRKQLETQRAALAPPPSPDYGRIDATLLAETRGPATFELSYLVQGASWTPDYDLFVSGDGSSTSDLVLVGNVRQATGIDWQGVALTLSAGDPNRRLQPGRARTRYVGGGPVRGSRALPGAYHPNPGRVSGVIYDEAGEPLIGASVVVPGTSVGTVSDLDGRYTLDVPPGTKQLMVQSTGYGSLTVPINSAEIDVRLSDGIELAEVVVVGYGGGGISDLLQGRAAGVQIGNATPPPATFAVESSALTSKTYRVGESFVLPADGQTAAVRLIRHELPLKQRYRALPKEEATAYLEGILTGWDSLGLVSGAMRLHLDGRYLGRDYLNASQTADSLLVPLGADDRVVVERKPITREMDRRPIRSRVDYEMGYEIKVRNTLSKPIDLVIEDQIPVKTRDEIDIELQESPDPPAYDAKTGTLSWTLSLRPSEAKTLEVVYEISAPREVQVAFE